MTTNPFARAGFEQGGQQTGSGGSFHVARAISVGGQIIRVVFSSPPKAKSSGAPDDALNAANYQVSVTTGTGDTPQSIATFATVTLWPAFGLRAAGEASIDLQVDRPLIVGMSYTVTASHALVAADGTPIGSPYGWTFSGSARPIRKRQQRRVIGLVDFASDPFTGGIAVDKSGDWGSQEGVPGTRKRIWRIALTPFGAFSFLSNFGLKYDIKKPGTLSILGSLRTELKQQLLQQPDVKDASSSVTMDQRGFLTLTINAQTTTGQKLSETVQATPSGMVTTQ